MSIASTERNEIVAMAHVERAVLTIPDMSCGHCVQTVTDALAPLVGVENVAVDLASKTIAVGFDPSQVTIRAMRDALANEDYPVAAVTHEHAA